VISYAIRKHLGLGIFAVAIVVTIAFIIYFIYRMNVLNDLNTQHLNTFSQILMPSYVVFIVHAVGQSVYEKCLKK
jgi:Na+-translocating ferredoxin:NAD+ oxidoreductase RnfA subunit